MFKRKKKSLSLPIIYEPQTFKVCKKCNKEFNTQIYCFFHQKNCIKCIECREDIEFFKNQIFILEYKLRISKHKIQNLLNKSAFIL